MGTRNTQKHGISRSKEGRRKNTHLATAVHQPSGLPHPHVSTAAYKRTKTKTPTPARVYTGPKGNRKSPHVRAREGTLKPHTRAQNSTSKKKKEQNKRIHRQDVSNEVATLTSRPVPNLSG
jgi:hypothetical protein